MSITTVDDSELGPQAGDSPFSAIDGEIPTVGVYWSTTGDMPMGAELVGEIRSTVDDSELDPQIRIPPTYGTSSPITLFTTWSRTSSRRSAMLRKLEAPFE
jgi:hypothetical protein